MEFIHKAGLAYQEDQVKQSKFNKILYSMAQPQQVVDPNVNPPEQELLEYRVAMDRLTSTFREEVQVRGVNTYTKLIHDLKITVCKFNSDLVEADEQAVLKSIKRHDGQHFKEGFMVKVRATSSREHHPDFSAAQYDREVHSAICKLHLDAADVHPVRPLFKIPKITNFGPT